MICFQLTAADAISCAVRDIDVDYHHFKGVSFSEFYDNMFELVDNITKSKLIREYVKLV